MKKLDVLIKAIILLLLEKIKYNNIASKNVIEELIDLELRQNKNNLDFNFSISYKLINVIKDMLDPNFDTANVLSTIEFILVDYPQYMDIIVKQLKDKPENISDKLLSYKKSEILNFINKEKAIELFKINLNKLRKVNVNVEDVVKEFKAHLDNLIVVTADKQDNITEVNLHNEQDIKDSAEDVSDMFTNTTILKTGWECINTMLSGGFRRGELACLSALPHNYKSSLVKSFFVQIATLNKPEPSKDGKKPMMVFLSLEEEMRVVIMFFYIYLKYSIDNVKIDPIKDKIDSNEMKQYIMDNFSKVTNFEIRIIREDPDKVTYESLINLADRLISQGYEIYAFFTDYLAQANTRGCVHGSTGSEYRDLFKKIRNAFSMRNILFCTPHQLSPAAKSLKRAGLSGKEFLNALVNKGYFEFSSKLDQEMDVSIFMDKHFINKEPYLGIRLDKHRIPIVAPEEDRYVDLKFPKEAPIPHDTDIHNVCHKDIGINDDEFGF